MDKSNENVGKSSETRAVAEFFRPSEMVSDNIAQRHELRDTDFFFFFIENR